MDTDWQYQQYGVGRPTFECGVHHLNSERSVARRLAFWLLITMISPNHFGGTIAMAIAEFLEFLAAAKSTLDIYKGVKGELPNEAAQKAEVEIAKAETALERGEAELAKKLGFRLCRCKFPPPIMLWDKNERAFAHPAVTSTHRSRILGYSKLPDRGADANLPADHFDESINAQ
jgi:hypothetical protein